MSITERVVYYRLRGFHQACDETAAAAALQTGQEGGRGDEAARTGRTDRPSSRCVTQ